MKQKFTEIKRELDNSKIIAGDLNTPLSIMNRTTRQKVNKKILEYHYTPIGHNNIYGTLLSTFSMVMNSFMQDFMNKSVNKYS